VIRGATLLLAVGVLVQLVDGTKTNSNKCRYPLKRIPGAGNVGPKILHHVKGIYYKPRTGKCEDGQISYGFNMKVDKKYLFKSMEECEKECLNTRCRYPVKNPVPHGTFCTFDLKHMKGINYSPRTGKCDDHLSYGGCQTIDKKYLFKSMEECEKECVNGGTQLVDSTKTNADKCTYPVTRIPVPDGTPCAEFLINVTGIYYNPRTGKCDDRVSYGCHAKFDSKIPGFKSMEECEKECLNGGAQG